MNILLTGATGFIGKHLLQYLSVQHNVYVLVRNETKHIPAEIKDVFIFNDNIEALTVFLKNNEIDGIIHLASLFLAEHQPEEVKDLILSNVYLGAALLEAAKKTGIKWFLNTGTYWQHYISDSQKYCPVNLYAATKQAFIDIAEYYTETTQIRFVTLIIGDTYGKGDYRRKILNLFKEYSENQEILEMSAGEQYIDLLYIDDVVNGFMKLLELLSKQKNILPEYVLSSSDRITLRELADIYQKTTKQQLHIKWGAKSYREREVMQLWEKGVIVPNWEKKIDIIKGIKLFTIDDE